MADEAFALSPISARATLPSEEDYAAISEAFMETSRGRWFLTEYAKRNRNADTSMVLDAVARIEQSLAAQKEDSLAAQREAAAAADTSLNEAKLAEARLAEARLAEAVAAIRDAVEAAQASAIEAMDGLALNEQLAPVRKGTRVLREIAWRLREIGNDGRICDLIDSQVSVIEQGAEQISSDEVKNEVKTALGAAFAAIEGRLAEFSGGATHAPVSPAPAPQEAAVAIAEAIEPEPAEAVELTVEAADAHDEALLDMIAMEMGAPDPFDPDEIIEPVAEVEFAEPPPVEPEIIAQLPEPMAAPVEPPVQPAPRPAVATPQPVEISLGSSIIASGIVRRPIVAANDPLAPIRRMSQAEKIAFFS